MTKGSLAFSILGMIAFGVVGYVVGSSREPLSTQAAPNAPTAQPPDVHRSSSLPSPRTENAAPEPERGSAEAPSTPGGSGTLTGHVRTADGDPLAGVLVRVEPVWKGDRQPSLPGGGPPKDVDVPTLVERYAAKQRFLREGREEGVTKADGGYEIHGLGKGEYTVKAWKKGYDVRAARWGVVHAGDTFDLTASVLLGISVTVELPDGSPALSANVRAVARSGSRISYGTDSGHVFMQVPPDAYEVSATGGPNRLYESEKKSVTVHTGRPNPAITLRLKSEPGLYGNVYFPAGETQSVREVRTWVAIVKDPDGGSDDAEKKLPGAGKTKTLYDTKARYAFRGLSPGTYLIGVITNRAVLTSRVVTVGSGMKKLDLTVPGLAPSNSFELRVRGPDGQPVSGIRLLIDKVSRRHRARYEPRFASLGGGVYRVANPPKSSADTSGKGRYFVVLTSGDYGKLAVEFEPGSTSDLTATFQKPASLDVDVSGFQAARRAGTLMVFIAEKSTGSQPTSYAIETWKRTTSDGKVAFYSLPPGSYTLRIEYSPDRSNRITLETKDVDLESGKNEEPFAFPPLYTLTVVAKGFPDVSEFDMVLRTPKGTREQSWRAEVSSNHVAVFKGLLAGEYTLSGYYDGKNGQMNVSVPASSSVRFQPQVLNADLVHIRDASGALGQAGLRNGDVIVAIDGKAFKDEQQMRALVSAATLEDKASLTVERGSNELTIAVDLKSLRDFKKAGGYFEPVSR